ncbi:glycoside hydrolase family 88 protein [Pseudopedobacter beijingensis]|uniref:Glycoside hydrolase family 88 protein n=1 Tax=Pseudopedobacter beijingensis TaxID=1207056 RepID=A0ABW4IGM2_9SPHI
MKKIASVLIGYIALIMANGQVYAQEDLGWLKNAKKSIVYQLKKASEAYKPGMNPRSIYANGTVRLAPQEDWTTGFFPGTLWYGYEMSGDKQLANSARKFTLAMDSLKNFTHTHDLGFMIYCSYGNAYRLTKDQAYLPTLKSGAANLYGRYNKTVGAIRSWDFGHWQFPVIIDNMMNLDYLYWAAKEFNKPEYEQASEQHALTTLKNHFRMDNSSYHVVSYDTLSGRAIEKGTHQGLTDESAWSRGQAWGLYGYTMSFKETNNKVFLDHAIAIAKFIMEHPNVDADKVPYWDYDIHNGGERAPRDASAAAVIASSLIDLAKYTNNQAYFKYAEDILKSLSSSAYLAKPNDNKYFILKHSVGAFLYNSEIDTPLNYADYYYLEALLRYAAAKNIDLKKLN